LYSIRASLFPNGILNLRYIERLDPAKHTENELLLFVGRRDMDVVQRVDELEV
jgi:hypothetical protein